MKAGCPHFEPEFMEHGEECADCYDGPLPGEPDPVLDALDWNPDDADEDDVS